MFGDQRQEATKYVIKEGYQDIFISSTKKKRGMVLFRSKKCLAWQTYY
ncbi:hypothetical protein ACVXZZ_17275 [Staphylococcus aureus]